MATLVIKNIPEPLLKRLRQQADAHRWNLNFQVISYLQQMAYSMPINIEDTDALLARMRAVRRSPKRIKLTDRILNKLTVAGRL